MTGAERMKFTLTFLPGLVLLVLTYTLLTAYRDFRDNFSAEIWESLGYGQSPEIFVLTESIVALVVLVVIGSLMVIRDNFKAMMINHLIVLIGLVLVGMGTFAFQRGWIDPMTWMIAVGMGLYFGYIQFNSIFFDRLIATFRIVSTVGFLIYLADSVGYVGSMGVVLFKEFGSELNWLDFFMSAGYVVSVVGTLLMLISLAYFNWKYRGWPKNG